MFPLIPPPFGHYPSPMVFSIHWLHHQSNECPWDPVCFMVNKSMYQLPHEQQGPHRQCLVYIHPGHLHVYAYIRGEYKKNTIRSRIPRSAWHRKYIGSTYVRKVQSYIRRRSDEYVVKTSGPLEQSYVNKDFPFRDHLYCQMLHIVYSTAIKNPIFMTFLCVLHTVCMCMWMNVGLCVFACLWTSTGPCLCEGVWYSCVHYS